MGPVLFYLGSLPVHSLGFMVAVGFIVGLFLAAKEARRKGIDPSLIWDLGLYLLVGGVVGARLGYVFLFNPGNYLSNPVEILMLHSGGLSIQGGVGGGILVGALFARKHKISLWRLADTLTPGLILGQAIGRTGCDVFGVPTARYLPWAVNVGGQLLHPAQVYEFLLNYFLFFILWRNRGRTQYDGQLFGTYVIAYGLVRGVVEFFRSNPVLFGPFTVAHGVSLLFIVGGVSLLALLPSLNAGSSPAPLEEKEPLLPQTFAVAGAAVLSLILFYYL